ncbi:MAG: SusE domain-containing protein [Niabella sp.]
MRTIHKFLLLLLLPAIFISCKKEENKVFFEGGTAPVLSASVNTPLVLSEADKAKSAITFSWTNPDYRFNTGISSQNVNYTLQVDKAGQNFAGSTLQEIGITSDLSKVFTVEELNAIPTRMDLADGIAHDLEVRIKSTMGTSNQVALVSNTLPLKVTPYLDVAVPVPPTGELYVTGSATASGWTENPPATQKFTAESKTLFTITVSLTGGGTNQIKFLAKLGSWQPQYGGENGVLGFNMGLPGQQDPKEIAIAESGSYKITVNFKTGRYTVEKQ